MKPLKYSEVYTLKISITQKRTLDKLKARGIVVSKFVRQAIQEKIQREYSSLQEKQKNIKTPF